VTALLRSSSKKWKLEKKRRDAAEGYSDETIIAFFI
jgi:hypothetical protein